MPLLAGDPPRRPGPGLHRPRRGPRLRRHHVPGPERVHRDARSSSRWGWRWTTSTSTGRCRARPSTRTTWRRGATTTPMWRCSGSTGRTRTSAWWRWRAIPARRGGPGSPSRPSCAGSPRGFRQTTVRTFQRTCDATFGDSRCKVGLTTSKYKGAGEIAEVLGPRTMRVTGLGAYDDDWFTQGVFTFVSSSTARCVISSQGLIVNAFHDEDGREGYFSPAVGHLGGAVPDDRGLASARRGRWPRAIRRPRPRLPRGRAPWSRAAGCRCTAASGRPTSRRARSTCRTGCSRRARGSRCGGSCWRRRWRSPRSAAGQVRGVLDDDDAVTVYQVYDQAGKLLWANPYSHVLDGASHHIVSTEFLGRGRRLGDRRVGHRRRDLQGRLCGERRGAHGGGVGLRGLAGLARPRPGRDRLRRRHAALGL